MGWVALLLAILVYHHPRPSGTVGGHDEPPCYVDTEVDVSEGLFPPPSDSQGVSGAVPGDGVPRQRSHTGQPGLATDGPQSGPDTASGSEFSGLWSYEQLAELQWADPSLGVVYRWVEHLVPPSREELLPHSIEVKTYVMQWVSLEIRNGVLYRRFERADGGGQFYQLLAPRSIRNELLRMLHSKAAGHLGVKKTRPGSATCLLVFVEDRHRAVLQALHGVLSVPSG